MMLPITSMYLASLNKCDTILQNIKRRFIIDHYRKYHNMYHNALCLLPQNFAQALSSVSLGKENGPKKN